MNPQEEERELAQRFLQQMLEATFSLQAGMDREITLHALIHAAGELKIRFENELEELRQEHD